MNNVFSRIILLVLVLTMVVFSCNAFAQMCAHANKTYIQSEVSMPVDKGTAHEITYFNVYKCLDCGETVKEIAAVAVDGHDYYQTDDEHISEGIHEVYYYCVCGSTYTATQKCFGPPCRIYYLGFEETYVDK